MKTKSQQALDEAKLIAEEKQNYFHFVPVEFWEYFEEVGWGGRKDGRNHRVVALCFYIAMMEGE